MLYAAVICCSIIKFLCPSAMMNTGQKRNATTWNPFVRRVRTWPFSAGMNPTGRQDGKTVWTEQIRQCGRWSVIRRGHWPHQPKTPVVENATDPQPPGRDYGVTDADTRVLRMPANLKTD